MAADTAVYSLSCIVVALVCLAFSLDFFFISIKGDPREPQYLLPRVPIVGHGVGILLERQQYYVGLRFDPFFKRLTYSRVLRHISLILPQRLRSPNLPVYSLNLLGSRMYILNSPDLAVALQRNSKTLSFQAYAAKFAASLCGLSPEAARIVTTTNIHGDEGSAEFGAVFLKIVHSKLSLGHSLNQLIRTANLGIAASVDKLDCEKSTRVDLMQWLRHAITLAATDAVYGSANPFKNEIVEKAFWDFDAGMALIAVAPFPNLLARKAIAGRHTIVHALTAYLVSGSYKTGSEYLQARYNHCFEYGLSFEDVARLDLGGLTALNSNTAPAAFWLTVYIFSHPCLLQSIRGEIAKIVSAQINPCGQLIRTLDVAQIKEKCPLFVSTFQEVLRLRSHGSTIRLVLQDTLLQDCHLLKKDGVVMIPAASLHSDPVVWGPTAGDFNPNRFIKKPSQPQLDSHVPTDMIGPRTPAKSQNRVPHGAFRVFGGGTSLCPGRHLASTELLAIVSMLIMRFEMDPVDGGLWKLPESSTRNMATAIPFPVRDVSVDVKPRKGWDGKWLLETSNLEGRIDIAAAVVG